MADTTKTIQLKIKGFKETFLDLFIRNPLNTFKALCFWTGLVVISLSSMAIVSAILFFTSLPSFEKQSFDDVKAHAIQVTGKRIKPKLQSHYKWTKMDEITRDLIFPIVYAEDGKFFEHDGVSFDALMRSLMANYKKGKIVQGGSTITQQLVKNLYLTHNRTIMRKLKEIVIAKKLEEKFSKNQILELYLNTAEFGPDIYGVTHGSEYYFDKSPKKINLAQGAFMALLLPSPRRYHYALHINKNISEAKRSKIRRILAAMEADGLISAKQYSKYTQYKFNKKRSPGSR